MNIIYVLLLCRRRGIFEILIILLLHRAPYTVSDGAGYFQYVQETKTNVSQNNQRNKTKKKKTA